VDEETTRQRIARLLREAPATPSEVADAVETTPASVLTHAEHLARSLEPTDERLLVAPPTCRDCGFDGFDEPANLPSRCPECRSESIEEPMLVIARPDS
jgi:predicted Zn-ribbon and HTH transcriptional regulator